MGLIKISSFLSVVMIGLAAALTSLGVLGMMSPVLAQEPELEINVPVAQPPPDDHISFAIIYPVVFTDPAVIEITDLSGNVVGQGEHTGEVRCSNECSQKTQLELNGVEYEYQFRTRKAVDPVERRAVVAGTGTKNSNGQREIFLFTATFQDNQDGTVWARYEASRQDASFIVPSSRGTFLFRQQ